MIVVLSGHVWELTECKVALKAESRGHISDVDVYQWMSPTMFQSIIPAV
jgi:hypothetical protein